MHFASPAYTLYIAKDLSSITEERFYCIQIFSIENRHKYCERQMLRKFYPVICDSVDT